MLEVKEFITWTLTMIPDFLMSEPICYIIGFFMLGFTIKIIYRLFNL